MHEPGRESGPGPKSGADRRDRNGIDSGGGDQERQRRLLGDDAGAPDPGAGCARLPESKLDGGYQRARIHVGDDYRAAAGVDGTRGAHRRMRVRFAHRGRFRPQGKCDLHAAVSSTRQTL